MPPRTGSTEGCPLRGCRSAPHRRDRLSESPADCVLSCRHSHPCKFSCVEPLAPCLSRTVTQRVAKDSRCMRGLRNSVAVCLKMRNKISMF